MYDNLSRKDIVNYIKQYFPRAKNPNQVQKGYKWIKVKSFLEDFKKSCPLKYTESMDLNDLSLYDDEQDVVLCLRERLSDDGTYVTLVFDFYRQHPLTLFLQDI